MAPVARSDRKRARAAAAALGHLLGDFRALPDGDEVAECARCGAGAALDAATVPVDLRGSAATDPCGSRAPAPGPAPRVNEARARAVSDALSNAEHPGAFQPCERGEERALRRQLDEVQRDLSKDGSAWLRARGFRADGAKGRKR